ncbi:MAG: NAD(P)-dependent dehydrogenase (short-subunit alcohol dehydrogenase family) [Myxococcota bacterium]|jgi:NAD(P)-dependent dehydrogenase (short-subunit alcohol dehydrogenase family)
MAWTAQNIGDQTGKTFVVTGANSGIGLEAVRQLAKHGAHVVMACRSADKAAAAVENIKADVPDASLEVVSLDLANLDSVAACAKTIKAAHPSFDVLVNNAGIMAIPRTLTQDGFEMQLGTNHLGHFALTAQLFDAIKPDGRVVCVGSLAHNLGKINFDDLMGETKYQKWGAYNQSKLANVLFYKELDRRLQSGGQAIKAVGCHPGYSSTNLQGVGPKVSGNPVRRGLWKMANVFTGMSAATGALPTLLAACDTTVKSGDYYGPRGLAHVWGKPKKHATHAKALDAAVAGRLWETSETLTGVKFPVN